MDRVNANLGLENSGRWSLYTGGLYIQLNYSEKCIGRTRRRSLYAGGLFMQVVFSTGSTVLYSAFFIQVYDTNSIDTIYGMILQCWFFFNKFISIWLAQTMEQHFETETSHILNFQGYLQHQDQIRFTGPPDRVIMHLRGLNMALRLTALPKWNIS